MFLLPHQKNLEILSNAYVNNVEIDEVINKIMAEMLSHIWIECFPNQKVWSSHWSLNVWLWADILALIEIYHKLLLININLSWIQGGSHKIDVFDRIDVLLYFTLLYIITNILSHSHYWSICFVTPTAEFLIALYSLIFR